MAPTNSAAWLTSSKRGLPLEVKEAPYTPPSENEIVVENRAIAINPVDTAKQILGGIHLPFIKYPCIIGGDVAGVVCEVGPGVTKFKVGDRVLGAALSLLPKVNKPSEGGFQKYTVVRAFMASLLPENISFEEAAVLPLTLGTASFGLFHKDQLALKPPTVPPPSNEKKEAVIITAGASNVGSSAIQLAVSAGYEVISTSSPKNFEYVKKLGASQVFDYHQKSIGDDLYKAVKGKPLAGGYAIGNGTVELLVELIRRRVREGEKASTKKFVAYASPPWPQDMPKTALGIAGVLGSTVWWMGSTALKSSLTGVATKFVDCGDLHEAEGAVAKHVWTEFMPKALASGQFVPAPEPMVVGHGLEKVQEGMDIVAKGVSKAKVVVSL
ncbi:zinc-binding oxidoreductase [Apodospora peruviana]|uniref:Zinc-binding oxidoreductase n=1 Tax=Apodospora peruviana TaxID=516989 RepID=A0AAE0M869_9PEZI|nr:zinc-binding oxidoreductase [Apodospora peruviana]